MTKDEQTSLNKDMSNDAVAVASKITIELVNTYYSCKWYQFNKRNKDIKAYIDKLWDRFGPPEYGNDY